MASVFDVAKYILSKRGPMTTMKLQKLCYYSQAWSLAWDEIPLFDEDFQAWANGPVCPELFNIHRGKFVLSSEEISDSFAEINNLTDEQKENIDKVLDYYGEKEAHWLSELTHQELPWKSTRNEAGVRPGESCSSVISKDSMQQYYSGL